MRLMRINFPVAIAVVVLANFPAVAAPNSGAKGLKAVEAEMSNFFKRSGHRHRQLFLPAVS
jgi:hypothetical protein